MRSAAATPFISRPNSTLRWAVRHGKSWAKSWKTTPRSKPRPVTDRPPISTSPLVGWRNPATMLRSVVLPQPLRPTTHRNSDSAIAMVTSRSAGTVRSAASYSNVRWRSSMKLIDRTGGPDMAPRPPALGRAPAEPWRASVSLQDTSRARHPDHAPSAHRAPLERLEDDALEDEPEDTDGDERGDHDVGVEELLGVEDQPAEAPARGGDHLAADHGDPGAREGLAQSGDHEGQRSRQHYLQEERAIVGAHGAGGTQPDAIHRPHACPRVEDQRERRRVEDERHRGGVAEAEPHDEHRHPRERRDRVQHAHQRQHEALDAPEAAHQHPQRHTDDRRKREADHDPVEGVQHVYEQGTVGNHGHERA